MTHWTMRLLLPRLMLALLAVNAKLWCQDSNLKQAATQRLQTVSQQLKLTEDQKSKILPVLMDEAPKVKALRADTSLPRQEKVSRLMEIRNETNVKIKPILTPDQQNKLDQMKPQMRLEIIRELRSSRGRP